MCFAYHKNTQINDSLLMTLKYKYLFCSVILLFDALLIKILLLLYAVDSRYKEPKSQAKTIYYNGVHYILNRDVLL
jgi:hypothetical protein